MRPGSFLGVLVLLGLAGGVAWYVKGREPMGPVAEDAPEAKAPGHGGAAAPAATTTPPPVRNDDASPTLPREALFSSAEVLPRSIPEGEMALVRVKASAVSQGQVPSGALLDALLATEKVYVRYATESARDRVRSGHVRVPAAAYTPEDAPRGIPLPVAVNFLASTGTEVVLRYPVVFVGGIPGESSPR